jgi:hypothetical protein
MHCNAYNKNMWNVLATEEYLTWFSNLSECAKEEINFIAYYFDKKRNGLLLTGGDKKGKDEKIFYKNLLKEAMELIEIYKDYNWQEENKKWQKN